MFQSNLPNLKPGDLVAGRFRIVEMIGSGGFSVVYRVHQEGMNRFIALKVLKPRAANDPRVVERFRREALFASHLTHPNTITLYDYGQTQDSLFYIAMEYLVGMDLSVVVQRGEPMDLKRVWKILVQCCRSLSEAHRLGLVHRDLKPENIFLSQREEGEESIKVLDFGVSKAISTFGNAGPATMAPLTQEGTVFGTPLYMAPEQAMAEQITPAVDVYALGHITFEMITGRAAYWDCNNPMDVMLRQVNDPPLALPAPWNKTPFSRLITRCTQKNPKKRIKDASRLLELLMDDAFDAYMDPMERPVSNRSLPETPALKVRTKETVEGEHKIEELYRWEFEALEETYAEVVRLQEPRLVVIRGKPGTGRSNLLRAFLRRLGSSTDNAPMVVHRQTAGEHIPHNAGLEADLAIAARMDLEAHGFDEVKRIVSKMYHQDSELASIDAENEIDSGPLSTLVNMRDTFLARMAGPFRERAAEGVVVWGVENLERADTLTVSFLDRLYLDLQAHPAPIMMVVTVSPDDLMRRPGMSRYSERLLQATRPYGRQLSLVPPGQRKPEDENLEVVEEPALSSEVSGSYFGMGEIEVISRSRGPVVAEPDTSPLSPEEVMEQGAEASSEVSAPEEDEGLDTFDKILGYMAQVGDEIPHGLWRMVSERLLEEPLQRVSPLIIDQAERFGILHQTSEFILFTKHSYAQMLRESFAQLAEVGEIHRVMSEILTEFYPQPNREQLRRIVDHKVGSGQITQAIYLLRDAGIASFRALDFDAARELYLYIQQLLDNVSPDMRADLDGDGVAEEIRVERPRIWLRLGEIHAALHEHGAAEDALQRAIREAPDDDTALRGRAYKLLGDLGSTQGRYADALKHYEQAQGAFRGAGMARAFVAVTGEMGLCALMQGQTGLAEDLLRQALENANKLRDKMLIARLNRYLGQVLTRRSRFVQAMEHLEVSMNLFEELHRETEVVLCLEELGNAAFASSQYERSRDYFTRAIAECSISHVRLARSPHLGLARALAALSNMAQAEGHLLEALALSGTSNAQFTQAEVHLHLGDLYMSMGQEEASRVHYQHVADIAKGIGHTRLWLDALIRQAYVDFDIGSHEAYERLTQAAEMAKAIGDRDAELQVRTHIIYFQLLEHGLEAKGDTFSTLLGQGKKMRLVRTPVLCWLFRADVSAARGEFDAAREELRQAYAAASQLGDYALFIPIARRDYMLQKELGTLGDPHLGAGFAIGALVPPEIGRRRFERPPGSVA